VRGEKKNRGNDEKNNGKWYKGKRKIKVIEGKG
jgi:hypothetical protein